MHQRTQDKIKVGIEAEMEEGLDRGRNAEMRESTAKHSEERINAGME
jgi:hypothetical protein